MSLQNDAGFLGATWALVGLSAPLEVNSPKFAQGGWLQKVGAGTLWLGGGLSQIPGASGMMWLNTDSVPFQWEGPARFYLYATGATVVAGIGFKCSPGLSLPFAG